MQFIKLNLNDGISNSGYHLQESKIQSHCAVLSAKLLQNSPESFLSEQNVINTAQRLVIALCIFNDPTEMCLSHQTPSNHHATGTSIYTGLCVLSPIDYICSIYRQLQFCFE